MSETTGGLCPVMSHLSSEKIITSTAPANKASTKDAVKENKTVNCGAAAKPQRNVGVAGTGVLAK